MLEELAEALKVLADPVRLQILEILSKKPAQKEFCVSELAFKLGISQPNISHHLKILKMMGFITCEKDKRFSYYMVNKAKIESVLRSVLERLHY